LDATSYWKEHVKDYASALIFYQLYYPEYPDVLMQACARTISATVERGKGDSEYAEQYMKDYYTRVAAKRDAGLDAGEEIREVEAKMLQQRKVGNTETIKQE
jgi:hypothetical protein